MNLNRIIYLSETDYAELIAEGSITKGGRTIVYNDNDIYITPGDAPDRLKHSITFGANQAYTFDGSADVVVPVYTGTII